MAYLTRALTLALTGLLKAADLVSDPLGGIAANTIIALDTFNRADTADIAGSTTEQGGLTWSYATGFSSGTFGISSHQGLVTPTGTPRPQLNVGANRYVEISLPAVQGVDVMYLLVNAVQDNSDAVYLAINTASAWTLNEFNNGVGGQSVSLAKATPPSAGDVIGVDSRAFPVVSVTLNGTAIGSMTCANAHNGTRANLGFGSQTNDVSWRVGYVKVLS